MAKSKEKKTKNSKKLADLRAKAQELWEAFEEERSYGTKASRDRAWGAYRAVSDLIQQMEEEGRKSISEEELSSKAHEAALKHETLSWESSKSSADQMFGRWLALSVLR